MQTYMNKLFLILLLVLSTSSNALAAPFCTVTSYGKDCSYSDFNFCQRTAQNLGGACITNSSENRYTPQSGNYPFCVVSSYGTDCSYSNVNLCKQTAQAVQGACAVNPNQ